MIKRWMYIHATGKNKSVASRNVFNIVFLKIELYKFQFILKIVLGKPIPVVLEHRFCKADANSFFHGSECFAVQISEIFAAHRFWIIGMCKISDGKIGKRFNMFLFYANIPKFMRDVN